MILPRRILVRGKGERSPPAGFVVRLLRAAWLRAGVEVMRLDEETNMTAKSDLKKHVRARQQKTGESYTAARAHVLRAREPNRGSPESGPERITGVVLKCNETSLRLRIPGADGTLTVRCSGYDAMRVSPAQLVEVALTRRWTLRDTPYASGSVHRFWTDVPALDLEPLKLRDRGIFDLNKDYEPFEPPDPYADMWAFFASTPRPGFEFDSIAWGAGVGVDPDDHGACLVADAAEISAYDPAGARDLLMRALLADLRCIDAHAHLGNLDFDYDPKRALTHYEIAVAIGELSLDPKFSGMLPWGCLYNRPFLRALHALGLCLWRLDQPQAARNVFERVLALNPNDNQGVRFCWEDIRHGRPWSPEGVAAQRIDHQNAH